MDILKSYLSSRPNSGSRCPQGGMAGCLAARLSFLWIAEYVSLFRYFFTWSLLVLGHNLLKEMYHDLISLNTSHRGTDVTYNTDNDALNSLLL